MAVWPDWMIETHRLINFLAERHQQGVISYGLSSYGYDVRLARKFKILPPDASGILDPKQFNKDLLVDIEADTWILPPGGFLLGHTVETVEVPRQCLGICLGKSTYARCGILVNTTPLEPQWRGQITLEISNMAPLPVKLYMQEGIAQLIFLDAKAVCRVSYADKKGKYQDQQGVVLPRCTSDRQAD